MNKYTKVLKILNWYNPFIKKQIIICRSACLGHDIFYEKYWKYKKIFLVCQQKTRLDLLINYLQDENNIARAKSREVRKHLLRKDVYYTIKQQEKLPWLKVSKFDYLLMDSFGELTDQKFTHKKDNWSFCCAYTDINHTAEFENIFSCDGLLSIDKIELTYESFFNWFEGKYPDKKVIFIHYSAKLDDRQSFKERAAEILRIMKKLEETKKYISNIYVNDQEVDYKESDKFPYHYSKSTMAEFKRLFDLAENKDK